MSIFSICKESREFQEIHGSDVLLSTYPGHVTYRRNDLFQNNETIYSFDEIVVMGVPQALQLHIPEYASSEVLSGLGKYSDYLKAVPDLSINILNQNILLMQKPHQVARWFTLTPKVTQTTAHPRVTTQQLANFYNLPTHQLTVYIDPSQYNWTPFENKEDLIVLSPDASDFKDLITDRLREQFPTYEMVIVKKMRYEDYKDTISRARFTVTFGEGFDGYFMEAFLSGGVAYAVYNDDFFPDNEYSEFENTYSDYYAMSQNIVTDMKSHNNKVRYEAIVDKNFRKIVGLYNFSSYKDNIRNFYLKRYTFLPQPNSAERLIANILDEYGKTIREKDASINDRNRKLALLIKKLASTNKAAE